MTDGKGARALVTGSSGAIGAAIARRLSAAGMRVLGLDARDPDERQEVATLRADLTAPGTVDALRARGPFDVLVAAAGIGYYAAVEAGEPSAVRRLLETNVLGTLASVQAVLPGMRERRRGTIVVISSIAGRFTWPTGGFYAASKAALESLCEALHMETASLGIRVAIVEPGSIASGFMDRAERARAPAGYAAPLAAFEAAAARLFTRGQDPALVADAVMRAIADERPFLRIPVGADAERELAALDASSRTAFLDRLAEIYGFGRPDLAGPEKTE